jgi:hypothetical protein
MAWLRRWFAPAPEMPVPAMAPHECDGCVEFAGESFDLAEGAYWQDGVPHPDLERARAWVARFGDAHGEAWLAVQREWTGWVAAHLGEGYRLHESGNALLVAALPMRAVKVALDYLALTQQRVARSLRGLAGDRLPEKQVVLLIEDDNDYYRYFSGRYPEDGEFPMSAGVHFNGPGPHFVVNGHDFEQVQPTIVHEMTHAFVAHLPLPAWLNEGLAVNMEIAFGRVADAHRLIALERQQREFWTPSNIQDYWSGHSYHRPDEGNELSYDLGRLMVAGLSADWPRFEAFAREADLADAGAAAAERHLHVDLGEFVRHYLQRDTGQWAPDPRAWSEAPERGAFAGWDGSSPLAAKQASGRGAPIDRLFG